MYMLLFHVVVTLHFNYEHTCNECVILNIWHDTSYTVWPVFCLSYSLISFYVSLYFWVKVFVCCMWPLLGKKMNKWICVYRRRIASPAKRVMVGCYTGAVFVAFYTYHVYYLAFVTFDYGYNMKANVAVGVYCSCIVKMGSACCFIFFVFTWASSEEFCYSFNCIAISRVYWS